jgi:hypothetical protein
VAFYAPEIIAEAVMDALFAETVIDVDPTTFGLKPAALPD